MALSAEQKRSLELFLDGGRGKMNIRSKRVGKEDTKWGMTKSNIDITEERMDCALRQLEDSNE